MASLDELRVYKSVCLKIRSTLVSGREDLVSPTIVTKHFVDGFTASLNEGGLIPNRSVETGEAMVMDAIGNGCPMDGDMESSEGNGCRNSCPFVESCPGWNVEYSEKRCEVCGSDALCACRKDMSSMAQLDLRHLEESVYREHFHGVQHWNYFTEEPDIGPIVLSLKQEPSGEAFRVLVRSSDHYLQVLIPVSKLETSQLSREEVINFVGRTMGLRTLFKQAHLPDIEQELLRVDETFVKSHMKVGLLRIKAKQRTEEEIFSNEQEPGPYDEFLNLLGQRVKLMGFKRFLGGLDADHNLTGEESVFVEYKGIEVMFHVATLMPFTANDPQQVNKKRHIGNDIVCLVFLDNNDAQFNPSWMRSHFVHSYIVVQHLVSSHGQPLYRMAVVNRSSVPTFSPALSSIPVMPHCKAMQHLVLSKIINAERASYHAPKFLKLTNRSRAQLLMELVASLTEHNMAAKHGRATRKISRRGTWLPIGASRPASPLMDPVREKYTNQDKLVEDFSSSLQAPDLADVVFYVGEEKIPVYGVKAILACRSRVFRTMFKEGQPISRMSSPLGRRRINSSSSLSNHSVSSPNLGRKVLKAQSPSKSKLIGVMSKKKKNGTSGAGCGEVGHRDVSASPEPQQIATALNEESRVVKEQYYVENFTEDVFSMLLQYLMTGACSIQPSTIVGITCAAEHFDIPELKQACFDRLTNCLMRDSVCMVLTQLEKYLSYHCAKTMVVRALEFVDSNAEHVLSCEEFLSLSENMVHLILRRDIEVQEILKVKAALSWGEVNIKPGQDFKKLVSPLVKHVRLHLIDAQDIMSVVVPSGIFENEKVMAALAYQVDPTSVETERFSMFKPRKKGSVLSSR